MKQLEYCNCPHLSSPKRQISKPVGVAQTVWVAERSTVVRGEECEGVVIDSCTLQRRHDLPDGPVHFFNSVANRTTWCFSTKPSGARVGGMDVVEGYVKIERLALFGLLVDEICCELNILCDKVMQAHWLLDDTRAVKQRQRYRLEGRGGSEVGGVTPKRYAHIL